MPDSPHIFPRQLLDRSWFTIGILCAILFIDRLAKQLAITGETGHLGPLTFGFFPNTGLVFSIPVNPLAGVLVMGVATIVVAMLFVQRRLRYARWDLAAGLLMVGAVSNLVDRLAYGHVIDIFFLAHWWPIFNVADLSIGAGLILYLVRRR